MSNEASEMSLISTRQLLVTTGVLEAKKFSFVLRTAVTSVCQGPQSKDLNRLINLSPVYNVNEEDKFST